jgi:hypothetical protein
MKIGGFVNSHGFNLASLMEAGRLAGYRLPQKIDILAIEISDGFSFSEKPTPRVAARIDEIAEYALEMVVVGCSKLGN